MPLQLSAHMVHIYLFLNKMVVDNIKRKINKGDTTKLNEKVNENQIKLYLI